jgi:hypothetical protein
MAVGGMFMTSSQAGPVGYFGVEMAGAGKVVKGVPYSAQVTTEFVQTLADGTVISRKQTGNVYRDSEGRTRREQSLGPIGPVGMAPNPVQLIFINDPVSGINYVLDSTKKTAQKLPSPKWIEASALAPQNAKVAASAIGQQTASEKLSSPKFFATFAPGQQSLAVATSTNSQQAAPESLGTKVIEGVQAEGTRLVMTIATGEIGNDRPIEVVNERWYSSQLQTVVMTKSSDPRMGDTTYQLTNISLAEPAHSLFEVPADYQIIDAPSGPGNMIFRSTDAK